MSKMKRKEAVTLPPDPEGMNDDRAEWANAAIKEFMRVCRTDEEDAPGDLIADIMHWCDRKGIDPIATLERAKSHYQEETLNIEGE